MGQFSAVLIDIGDVLDELSRKVSACPEVDTVPGQCAWSCEVFRYDISEHVLAGLSQVHVTK